MRLRDHIIVTAVFGIVFSHIVTSFDIRRRREVPDTPESYKYYVRPFVVPEPALQIDPLLKAQSVAESTSVKQYQPPLLAPLSPPSQQHSGGYQPPIPMLAAAPRPQEITRQRAPPERKPLHFPVTDITELSQSPPERRLDAIDSRSKAVGSSHHPSQAIHQVPASEIQSDKGTLAKDRDSAKNDEYVVYYYYYYDNDTNSANNLTLNFDDIPSLDSYDDPKSSKEPAKSASSRSIAANVNALTSTAEDQPKDSPQRVPTTPKTSPPSSASQPRSISSDSAAEPIIRADKPDNTLDDTVVQPLKPVSNVFRYGSNEVPRFPVLPNFIVSEVPKEVKPEEQTTPDTLSTPPSTTLPTSTITGASADERLQPEVDRDDDANNVLDSDTRVVEDHEEKAAPESSTTTTTTTTTEPPTTTEVQTTTTEKSRRRPGLPVGSRRNFGRTSAAPPPPPRGRQTPARSTSSVSATTSSVTSTTSAPSSPRSFRGSSSNRLRPRPPVGGNRPRPSLASSKAEDSEDAGSSKAAETTSTTASRSRLSTTSAPRRFAGGRNSLSRAASTSSTTASPRPRTTSRPRPNIVTRNRPRPGFLRPRPGKEEEPEVVQTTTPEAEVTEEKDTESPNPAEETDAEEEEEEGESPATETPEAEEETEEPTTTEKNRFAALFRPRNRNGSGNRPRPVIANRPPRSRR